MYKVENSAELFEFEVDGKQYSIPTLTNLPMKKFREIQRRIRGAKDGLKEEEAVYSLLDVFDELAPGSTDSLTYIQAAKLVKEYTTGNDELGEF